MNSLRFTLWSLVWLATVLFGISVMAVPVDLPTAGEAAGRALEAKNRLERREQTKRGVTVFRERTMAAGRKLADPETGETLAYVFPLDPSGYLVISADTDISPVVAYSFDGGFPWETPSPNPLLDLVTWDMQNRLAARPLISDELRAENNRLWENYLTDDAVFLKELGAAVVYGPYLSTDWHQEDPYNKYCPWDPDNSRRCIVGCVATAMAQVINYHRYPSSVTFTAADSYQNISPNVYINAPGANISIISYPSGEDTAARLSYACGVSVRMDYGWWSSSAQQDAPAAALTGKWGYSSASYVQNTSDQLYPYLRSDMINRRPSLVCVFKPAVYWHEIVCDGYNSTSGQYHLNFGLGWITDTWYTMPGGMPDGYNSVVSGVVNIVPGSGPVPPSSDYRVLAGGDYNGNGKSDIAVFRPNQGLWAIRGVTRVFFGGSGDIPVPGNYWGDYKTEICIFRPSSGLWSFRESGGAVGRLYYGKSGDTPVPADYTGNGTTDVAVFRPSSGLWAINGKGRYYFGGPGDLPVPAVYSQASPPTADIGIFRPATGLWSFRNGLRLYFGRNGDTPVPGDYDGDGDAVAAIYRPSSGLWAYFNPSGLQRIYFGGSSDQAVPGDYNGDGVDDLGVFRNSLGLWVVRNLFRVYYGKPGDIAVTR